MCVRSPLDRLDRLDPHRRQGLRHIEQEIAFVDDVDDQFEPARGE